MATPTSRTLALLRDAGWTAVVCERRVPRCFTTIDLFGLADIAAVRRGELLLVQATSGSNHQARVRKCLASDVLPLLLSVPGLTFEVWSWRKGGPRGQRKTWRCRRQPLHASTNEDNSNA